MDTWHFPEELSDYTVHGLTYRYKHWLVASQLAVHRLITLCPSVTFLMRFSQSSYSCRHWWTPETSLKTFRHQLSYLSIVCHNFVSQLGMIFSLRLALPWLSSWGLLKALLQAPGAGGLELPRESRLVGPRWFHGGGVLVNKMGVLGPTGTSKVLDLKRERESNIHLYCLTYYSLRM